MRSRAARARGRLAILGLATWGGLLLLAPPAWAHDELLASDPVAGATLDVAPEQARFTYSAAVAADFTQAGVTPPGGQQIALGPPQLEVDGAVVTVPVGSLAPDAAPGEWTLVVRVVSSDGHPVASSLTFTTTSAPDAGPPVTAGATASGATASGATASGATASGATASGATASGATASGATASGSPDSDPPGLSTASSEATRAGWSSGTVVAAAIVAAVLVGGAGAFALARRG